MDFQVFLWIIVHIMCLGCFSCDGMKVCTSNLEELTASIFRGTECV